MALIGRIKEYFALRRCDKGKHDWKEEFPGIWTGAYVSCKVCGTREVLGAEIYGTPAFYWVTYAATPPDRREALFWGTDEWNKWVKENNYGT